MNEIDRHGGARRHGGDQQRQLPRVAYRRAVDGGNDIAALYAGWSSPGYWLAVGRQAHRPLA
jgi:hypothetical protein